MDLQTVAQLHQEWMDAFDAYRAEAGDYVRVRKATEADKTLKPIDENYQRLEAAESTARERYRNAAAELGWFPLA